MKHPPIITNRHIQQVEKRMGLHWDALKELYSTDPQNLPAPSEKERYELVQQLMHSVETEKGSARAEAAQQLLGVMRQDALTPAEHALFTNPTLIETLLNRAEHKIKGAKGGFER